MKRNKLDKQIVKALALGISASMALQPVVAFAANEEPETEPEKEAGEELKSVDPVDEAASAAQNAAAAAIAEIAQAGTNVNPVATNLIATAAAPDNTVSIPEGEVAKADAPVMADISESKVAKAAAPENIGADEDAMSGMLFNKKTMPVWLALFAGAGVTVEEFARRKKKKAEKNK